MAIVDLNVNGVIVGINKYIDSRNLNFCVKDAIAFRDFLIDPQYGTRDPEKILLLTDGVEPELLPFKSNILATLDLVAGVSQPGDVLIFYFAGHGDDIDGEPALLPSDYRTGRGIDSAIKLEDVKQILRGAKASYKLLLLDSCHSGAARGRAESGKMGRATYDAIQDIPIGFSVVSACSFDQLSYEDDEFEHGIFTYYLLNGARGEADGNGDGNITINELYEYVTPLVRTRAFQKHRASQTPFLETKVAGIYALSNIETGIVTEPSSEPTFFKMIRLTHTAARNSSQRESIINNILLGLRRSYGIANLNDDGNMVTFPDGVINRKDRNVISQYPLTIEFDYSNNNKTVINEAISSIDNIGFFGSGWINIEFMSPYLLDIIKIEQVCDSNDWSITKLILKEPKSVSFITDFFVDINHEEITKGYNIGVILSDESSIIQIGEEAGQILRGDFYDDINADATSDLFKQFLPNRT